MGRWVVFVCVLSLAGCKSRSLNFLEAEAAKFRVDNEEIRAADLEARYAAQKAKSDRLATDLMALGQRRDALYREYDALRAALAQARQDSATAVKQRAAAEAALKKTKAETDALRRKLAAERKAAETLERELEAARKKRDALEAKKRGVKTPE